MTATWCRDLRCNKLCAVYLATYRLVVWQQLTDCFILLQSDATYLVVTDDGQIEKYGLNAVCTHLGCVVPWNNVSLLLCHL